MKTSKEYASAWKQIAKTWKLLSFPWRPNKINLADYERFLLKSIKGVKNPRVLLLGATPEIRDMLAQYKNIEVVLVDYNIEMILAMSELTKIDNSKNEVWVKSDWINMPLKEKYFDAVLGDYITTNLHVRDQEALIEKIQRLLKPNGSFISKIFYFNTDIKMISFDDIVDRYNKKPINYRKASDFACELFKYAVYKEKNYYVFSLSNVKKLRDKFKREHGDIKLLKILDELLSPYKKVWFYYDQNNKEKILNKYFIIKDRSMEDKSSTLDKNSIIYNLRSRK